MNIELAHAIKRCDFKRVDEILELGLNINTFIQKPYKPMFLLLFSFLKEIDNDARLKTFEVLVKHEVDLSVETTPDAEIFPELQNSIYNLTEFLIYSISMLTLQSTAPILDALLSNGAPPPIRQMNKSSVCYDDVTTVLNDTDFSPLKFLIVRCRDDVINECMRHMIITDVLKAHIRRGSAEIIAVMIKHGITFNDEEAILLQFSDLDIPTQGLSLKQQMELQILLHSTSEQNSFQPKELTLFN